MTKSRKSPTGFIVVLPGEIIEIPQDNDRSWLTLFYCLPREMAEKYPEALEIPRCPYEVLRTHKYDKIVKSDMLKLLTQIPFLTIAIIWFIVRMRSLSQLRVAKKPWISFLALVASFP